VVDERVVGEPLRGAGVECSEGEVRVLAGVDEVLVEAP
jgi:hypothetical protein